MALKEILKGTEIKVNSCDKKRPNMIVVWIIVAALAVLAMSSFVDTDKKIDVKESEFKDTAEYCREQEVRLEAVLKKIDGAGNVSVFIKLEDGGERVTAKDEKSAVEEDGESQNKQFETNVVLSERGSDSMPYIVKERTPRIEGVLVVASGASDESVKVKIYEAVKAVYGMSPHRIQVTY